MICEKILSAACQTEGEVYDTGLRIREFEVWGIPPHHYRHYTEFYLRHPQPFPYEVRKDEKPFLGSYRWSIGFQTPDGKWRTRWQCQESKEEAQRNMERWTDGWAYATCGINVFYTRTGKPDGSFCDKSQGIPCGVILDRDYNWNVFNIEVAPGEAQRLLDFAEEVQASWKLRASKWIRREAKTLKAVASAVAFDDLSPAIINSIYGATECLECGAIYDEPGHVEAGGMGCDRC